MNIIRRHVHLPASLSLQATKPVMKTKAVTEEEEMEKDDGDDDEEDGDEYNIHLQHTKSFAYKTPANGHRRADGDEHDAGNRRSMTPSVLHTDRFERNATRSRR